LKKFIYIFLKIFGVNSVLVTVLFALLTFSAFMDRINNGPGVMFAAVEILLIITIIFLILSFVFLFSARRLKKAITLNQ